MDFSDPQTLITLLSSVMGAKLAKLTVAAMIWMNAARLVFKPLQTKIQTGADSFRVWLNQEGNTELYRKVTTFESKQWVRFSFWLLDYTLSIKLGTQHPK